MVSAPVPVRETWCRGFLLAEWGQEASISKVLVPRNLELADQVSKFVFPRVILKSKFSCALIC